MVRYIVGSGSFYSAISNKAAAGTWTTLKLDLMTCCVKVWQVVKKTLCQDSPEGHEDENDLSQGYDIGLKDTLSFCWRALKESRSAPIAWLS